MRVAGTDGIVVPQLVLIVVDHEEPAQTLAMPAWSRDSRPSCWAIPDAHAAGHARRAVAAAGATSAAARARRAVTMADAQCLVAATVQHGALHDADLGVYRRWVVEPF
jgi:hypothetical protein